MALFVELPEIQDYDTLSFKKCRSQLDSNEEILPGGKVHWYTYTSMLYICHRKLSDPPVWK